MRSPRPSHRSSRVLGVAAATLFLMSQLLAAEERPQSGQATADDLSTGKIVDVWNLFSNVGTLIYFVEPNDFGLPLGIISHCTGTLIHERILLVAGHCTSQTQPGLPPFVKAFVTLSPNALDRSSWRAVTDLRFHPSFAFCRLNDCPYEPLKAGALDIGLAVLEQPVRDVTPARLARPGMLEHPGAVGELMVVAGYGFLNSLPGGVPPPTSEWDGLRRIKVSRLQRVVDDEWASWSLPGIVCYGDSGAPTFFQDNPLGGWSHARVVAVASDGGFECFTRDDRARVDSVAAQEWIRQTIAEVLGPPR